MVYCCTVGLGCTAVSVPSITLRHTLCVSRKGKRCWIFLRLQVCCSVTHLTDSGALRVVHLCEPRYSWVTLQHFATEMPRTGGWTTHPLGRHIRTHTLSLVVTAPASSWVGLAEECDVSGAQNLCCIRTQGATRLCCYWQRNLKEGGEGGVGVPWLSLQHCGSSPPPLLSCCQLTTFLLFSANLCPSVPVQTFCGWCVNIKANHDIC